MLNTSTNAHVPRAGDSKGGLIRTMYMWKMPLGNPLLRMLIKKTENKKKELEAGS